MIEQYSLVAPATVVLKEADLDAALSGVNKTALDNPMPAQNIDNIPNVPGHYTILCSQESPHGTQLPQRDDGKYIVYNGSASKMRDRLRKHLFVPADGRWVCHSGMPWNHMTADKFQRLLDAGDVDEYLSVYYKRGVVDDQDVRFLNGINVDSPQFKDHKFYISFTATENYGAALERLFRKTYGKPPLNRNK